VRRKFIALGASLLGAIGLLVTSSGVAEASTVTGTSHTCGTVGYVTSQWENNGGLYKPITAGWNISGSGLLVGEMDVSYFIDGTVYNSSKYIITPNAASGSRSLNTNWPSASGLHEKVRVTIFYDGNCSAYMYSPEG